MGAILYNAQPGTSDAALYTASSETPIDKLVAVNATGGAVTLTLSVHRAISGVAESLCSALSIPTETALSLVEDRLLALEEILLLPGDSLHGLAGSGSSITVIAF